MAKGIYSVNAGIASQKATKAKKAQASKKKRAQKKKEVVKEETPETTE